MEMIIIFGIVAQLLLSGLMCKNATDEVSSWKSKTALRYEKVIKSVMCVFASSQILVMEAIISSGVNNRTAKPVIFCMCVCVKLFSTSFLYSCSSGPKPFPPPTCLIK